jgi:hypothetical protein
MEHQPARSEYKKVWSALSTTEDQAKLHVIGVTEEAACRRLRGNLEVFQDSVGIERRMWFLKSAADWACRQSCGAALPKMDRLRRRLEHARADRTTIKGFVECGASGDIRLRFERRCGCFGGRCLLHGVFMHLEPWDQNNCVLEAFRVLRPKGRIYVDNINLCSDGGWGV